MFKVRVAFDGESQTMTVAQFLEENAGVPVLCDGVQRMLPGETVSANGMHIERIEVERKPKHVAKFKIDWRFDKTTSATVLINRNTGMVEVRPHRRHKSYFANLADLAQITCERAIAAEKANKKKEKKLRFKRKAA